MHSESPPTNGIDDLLEQVEHLRCPNLQEIKNFILRYQQETIKTTTPLKIHVLLQFFLRSLKRLATTPYHFENYHQMIPGHYQWSLELTEQLIDASKSTLLGLENVQMIDSAIQHGSNILLLANHQTELDPQIIMSQLRQHNKEHLGKDIIFIAGHRVTQDLCAQPFSMGCNLLNVYAKKYLKNPSEEERQKRAFNQVTFKKLLQLLKQGGKCIFVAAAGGRDRKNSQGKVLVQPFDPESIALLKLLAKKSQTPTWICPLALKSFDLLPPPSSSVQNYLGEERYPKYSPVFLYFGQPQLIEQTPQDKESSLLYQQVCDLYANFP